MKTLLTNSHMDFIKANRLTMSASDMARKFGISKDIVGRYMRRNGIIVSDELKNVFKARALTGKSTSTKKIDRQLKAEYLTVPVKTIALKVGKSSTFVNTRLRQLGLVIPESIIAERKQATRIKQGDIPFNKGRKQIEYLTPETIERNKKTWFKKGSLPPNTKSDLK